MPRGGKEHEFRYTPIKSLRSFEKLWPRDEKLSRIWWHGRWDVSESLLHSPQLGSCFHARPNFVFCVVQYQNKCSWRPDTWLNAQSPRLSYQMHFEVMRRGIAAKPSDSLSHTRHPTIACGLWVRLWAETKGDTVPCHTPYHSGESYHLLWEH